MPLRRNRPRKPYLCRCDRFPVQVPVICLINIAAVQTGVVFDAPPIGKKFGAVLTDVKTTAYHAGDTVTATFVGANPRVSSYEKFSR